MNSDKSDQILDTAAGWVARLRSDAVCEADRQAFGLWLAADAEHTTAMDAMLDLWEDLEVVKHLPLKQPASGRRQWLAGGLALAASLLLALLLVPGMQTGSGPQSYQTRVGERLMVKLADGSQITLNTNSHLLVQLDAQQRQLVLTRGEAYFDVARDTDRPFVVTAGDTRVTVLGTAFNIYLEQGTSHITVTAGTVRINELTDPATRPADSLVLHPNQAVNGSAAGLAEPYGVNAAAALAWRDGKLVAAGMTLLELVQELSRYHPQQLLVADPDVGQMTVSGVFELSDPDAILLALEHSLEVRAVTLENGSIQLLRAPL